MTSIFVATDLSARSDRAVDRAFRLAAEQSARLVVISVVDDALPEAMADRLTEEVRQTLATRCAAPAAAHAVEVETRVAVGDPTVAIEAAAAAEGADLLVLGMHRARPIMDMFRGTTAERLIRGALRPVLLVKERADTPYASVVAGVDLSAASTAALRAARRWAPEAALHAFHAVHVPFMGFKGEIGDTEAAFTGAARAELDAWIAAGGLPEGVAPPSVTTDSVSTALGRAIAERKPDLLALGAHGRAGLSPTLLGGFTEAVLRDPPCDVLVVRRDPS